MPTNLRSKGFSQYAGTEDGIQWRIRLVIYENETFHSKGGTFDIVGTKERYHKDKKKEIMRSSDRKWVMLNIPSSIWWHTEVHHDWDNGGMMYLLTRKDHILLHRKQ